MPATTRLFHVRLRESLLQAQTPELVTECQGPWMGAPVARTSMFSVDLREKCKVARRSFEK
ncbi:hypothetical protein CY34DRAFT_808509 [Suillus luteus UH-Slu-Lm8-n1]|uniref:Uncharacterized protein n=1 Tax=Suillus luteus UH-Slu-Lm8-n1 TaxID=930992 RepID=A0A0C9ZNK8_9AGAM|nr:hypothetical protein CY34DRAFT_808509 [Suillus luteus UH-Slu-Lm8-n1]